MTEEENKVNENAEAEEPTTEIRDTDIVFDCPHCGHNLAIDYKGAGLAIDCVNCHQSVLVPIPFGMQIDDLDLEPGEILKRLFATRRSLQKAEARAAELEVELQEMTAKRDALRATLATTLVQVNTLREIAGEQTNLQNRVFDVLGHMETAVPLDDEADGTGVADGTDGAAADDASAVESESAAE